MLFILFWALSVVYGNVLGIIFPWRRLQLLANMVFIAVKAVVHIHITNSNSIIVADIKFIVHVI